MDNNLIGEQNLLDILKNLQEEKGKIQGFPDYVDELDERTKLNLEQALTAVKYGVPVGYIEDDSYYTGTRRDNYSFFQLKDGNNISKRIASLPMNKRYLKIFINPRFPNQQKVMQILNSLVEYDKQRFISDNGNEIGVNERKSLVEKIEATKHFTDDESFKNNDLRIKYNEGYEGTLTYDYNQYVFRYDKDDPEKKENVNFSTTVDAAEYFIKKIQPERVMNIEDTNHLFFDEMYAAEKYVGMVRDLSQLVNGSKKDSPDRSTDGLVVKYGDGLTGMMHFDRDGKFTFSYDESDMSGGRFYQSENIPKKFDAPELAANFLANQIHPTSVMKMKDEMVIRETLYIIEKKLSKKEIDATVKSANECLKNKIITKEKYSAVLRKLDTGWFIDDALSYSKNPAEVIRECKKLNGLLRRNFRVVETSCVYHKKHGVSFQDSGYEVVKVLRSRGKEHEKLIDTNTIKELRGIDKIEKTKHITDNVKEKYETALEKCVGAEILPDFSFERYFRQGQTELLTFKNRILEDELCIDHEGNIYQKEEGSNRYEIMPKQDADLLVSEYIFQNNAERQEREYEAGLEDPDFQVTTEMLLKHYQMEQESLLEPETREESIIKEESMVTNVEIKDIPEEVKDLFNQVLDKDNEKSPLHDAYYTKQIEGLSSVDAKIKWVKEYYLKNADYSEDRNVCRKETAAGNEALKELYSIKYGFDKLLKGMDLSKSVDLNEVFNARTVSVSKEVSNDLKPAKNNGFVNANADQKTIDAPSSVDITSDSIHDALMKLSDGESKTFNINGNKCTVWADFDEIIGGDKFYRYVLDISDKTVFTDLNFSRLSQMLDRAITTKDLADRIEAESELSYLKPGEYKTVNPEHLKYVNSDHIQQLVGSNDVRDLGQFFKDSYEAKLVSLEQFMEFNKTSSALVEARKKMNQVTPEKVNEFTGQIEEKLDSLLYLKARNYSLETYCKNKGYTLQKAGEYMKVNGLSGAENDSVLIKGNSFTAKDGELSGDTVSFVRKYENKSKNEAIIDILASGKNISRTQDFEKNMKIDQPALSR